MLAFMLVGVLGFANTDLYTPEYDSSIEKPEKLLACTSVTVTTTTTNPDGSSTSTSTTTVKCDTPEELVRYESAIKNIR